MPFRQRRASIPANGRAGRSRRSLRLGTSSERRRADYPARLGACSRRRARTRGGPEKRIFRERMRHIGGRETSAGSPQPIAKLNDLLGKIDWPEVVVFTFECLLKRRWLPSSPPVRAVASVAVTDPLSATRCHWSESEDLTCDRYQFQVPLRLSGIGDPSLVQRPCQFRGSSGL